MRTPRGDGRCRGGHRWERRGDDRRRRGRGRFRRERGGRPGGGLADRRLLRRAIEHHDRQERAEHGREAPSRPDKYHRRASPKGHRGEAAALDPGPHPRAEVARRSDVAEAAHDPPLLGERGKRRAALAAGVEMGIEPLTLGVCQLIGERCADQLLERLVAIHRHRAKPSAARWRRISPRARQSRVRTAAYERPITSPICCGLMSSRSLRSRHWR